MWLLASTVLRRKKAGKDGESVHLPEPVTSLKHQDYTTSSHLASKSQVWLKDMLFFLQVEMAIP